MREYTLRSKGFTLPAPARKHTAAAAPAPLRDSVLPPAPSRLLMHMRGIVESSCPRNCSQGRHRLKSEEYVEATAMAYVHPLDLRLRKAWEVTCWLAVISGAPAPDMPTYVDAISAFEVVFRIANKGRDEHPVVMRDLRVSPVR